MQKDAAAARGAAEVQVRFAADAASVPGARRFVADGLASWGLVELVDDAVRLTVEDEGVVPAEALVPRPRFPDPDDELDDLRLEDEPTTGRGLAIVSVLASDWGVDETESGRRVWAE